MHSFLTPIAPDLPPNPDVFHIYPEASIGITEIRAVQTFLSRKPLQSPHNTVIVHDAQLLTLPAQQAFLKTLEEPPAASEIYLVTAFPNQLLPTILSRVSRIDASMDQQTISPSLKASQELFDQLLPAGVGERLALFDRANFDRESALQFLADLEQILHSDIIKLSPSLKVKEGIGVSYEKISDLIFQARTYLQANVNIRLALDHFAINL